MKVTINVTAECLEGDPMDTCDCPLFRAAKAAGIPLSNMGGWHAYLIGKDGHIVTVAIPPEGRSGEIIGGKVKEPFSFEWESPLFDGLVPA